MKLDRRMNPPKQEGGTALADLPEFKALKERLELPPPEREVIPRTIKGPRQKSDPFPIYSGRNIRLEIVRDQEEGDRYYLETQRPLERHHQDMVIAAGFDPIGELDTALHWEASRKNVIESGKDLNVLAVVLDGKGERLGRSR